MPTNERPFDLIPVPIPLAARERRVASALMVPLTHEVRGEAGELESGLPLLRVLFLLTSMPVGGAETLLANLMRKMNPARFSVELGCLKELGPLGEELSRTYPVTSRLLSHKYDLRVLPRLVRRLHGRVDAVVTVGAGDKMFWGRIAGHLAGTPVVLSALHSTGWPDGIGRLNRLLTRWTDGFIAVAPPHGRYLVEQERLPAEKVFVIPNGVDTQRFHFDPAAPFVIRRELGIPAGTPLVGIVAALRPEKNHRLFLQVAQRVVAELPTTQFLIIGDGPELAGLRATARELDLVDRVHFLGTRSDIPQLLSALNVFCLTSDNEANPVSILEALAVRVPVVATDVGSVAATVQPGRTGFLAPAGDAAALSRFVVQVLQDPLLAQRLGETGRDQVVKHGSVERMVRGYEQLITEIYLRKRQGPGAAPVAPQSVEFCAATP